MFRFFIIRRTRKSETTLTWAPKIRLRRPLGVVTGTGNIGVPPPRKHDTPKRRPAHAEGSVLVPGEGQSEGMIQPVTPLQRLWPAIVPVRRDRGARQGKEEDQAGLFGVRVISHRII